MNKFPNITTTWWLLYKKNKLRHNSAWRNSSLVSDILPTDHLQPWCSAHRQHFLPAPMEELQFIGQSSNEHHSSQTCYLFRVWVFVLLRLAISTRNSVTTGYKLPISTTLASTRSTWVNSMRSQKNRNEFWLHLQSMDLYAMLGIFRLMEHILSNHLRGMFGFHDSLSSRSSLVACLCRPP